MRVLDISFSFILIILLSPILLFVAICLALTGEKKIFYRQDRVGINGKTFKLLKFATMLENSPNIGAGDITLRNDPRILPFGKILRKTKLNEVPQLWNIFIGEMSFVGYRPLTSKNFNYYSPNAKIVFSLHKPGLTGIGSIFFRNEEKYMSTSDDPVLFYRDVIAPFKEDLELWYCKRASLKNYFITICLTFIALFIDDERIMRWFYPDLPSTPEELR